MVVHRQGQGSGLPGCLVLHPHRGVVRTDVRPADGIAVQDDQSMIVPKSVSFGVLGCWLKDSVIS